mmetsp:Transcript_66707/g.168280  ORF Transcript_66707/g.168280 Transcript_66707/m.168280 type:complete len:225 (+) Transcript_66707:45-719(+)
MPSATVTSIQRARPEPRNSSMAPLLMALSKRPAANSSGEVPAAVGSTRQSRSGNSKRTPSSQATMTCPAARDTCTPRPCSGTRTHSCNLRHPSPTASLKPLKSTTCPSVPRRTLTAKEPPNSRARWPCCTANLVQLNWKLGPWSVSSTSPATPAVVLLPLVLSRGWNPPDGDIGAVSRAAQALGLDTETFIGQSDGGVVDTGSAAAVARRGDAATAAVGGLSSL